MTATSSATTLDVIRTATGQEPPKLRFFHMTRMKIAGKDVVHTALLEAGAKHGMVKVGGSFFSENIEDYYFTPFELDYGRIIGFDHDFVGRAALEKMVANGQSQRRKKVNFVWSSDDTAAAYGSLFHQGPGAKFMNLPMSLYDTFHADRVEVNGKVVGISNWTGYSANERAMLSLGTIDVELAKPGTEVTVVWGEDRPSSKCRSRRMCPAESARRSCRRLWSRRRGRRIGRMPG
jgi:glycine cleavage system aminomethyltransferase T